MHESSLLCVNMYEFFFLLHLCSYLETQSKDKKAEICALDEYLLYLKGISHLK